MGWTCNVWLASRLHPIGVGYRDHYRFRDGLTEVAQAKEHRLGDDPGR